MKTSNRRVAALAMAAAAGLGVSPLVLGGANDFTLVLLPDTQYYSQNESNAESFRAQTQWIVNNQAAMNIAFVDHVGDVVNNGWNDTQWNKAVGAMNTLRSSTIPFGLAPGNHDEWETKPPVTYNSHKFVDYFGPSYFTGKSWYGGASASGFSSFQTFTAAGRQYLNLNIDVNASQTELTWAQSVIDSHPNVLTVLNTHDDLTDSGVRGNGLSVPLSGRNSGEQIWQKFVKSNNQVFLVVNGHYSGQNQQLSFNDAGREVFEVMADYQSLQVNGQDNGMGFMRLMSFDPDAGRMSVRTYSPVLGRDLQSGDGMTGGLGNFGFSIDLDNRFNLAAPLLNTFNWNAGTSGNWSEAARWAENAVPAAGLTSLNFAGSTNYSANNDLPGGAFPLMVQQLNFANTAGTVTVGGASMINMRGGNGDLGTALINQSGGGKATISAMINLASPTTAYIDGELTITNNFRNYKTFTKEGNGTLILSGSAGRFVGNTTIQINAGSIRMGANDAIYSQTSVNLGPNGTLDDSYGNGEGFAMLSGTGTYLGRHGANFNLGENNASGTFAGKITAGTNGAVGATAADRQLLLKKTNTGTLTLTGTNSDFAGQTQVLLGTLELTQVANRGQNSALGLGDVNNLGNGAGANLGIDIAIGDAATSTTLSTDAKLRYSGPSASTDRTIGVVGNGGAIEVTSASADLRLTSSLAGAGELVKAGAGTLTLAATPTNTGAITINGGTLAMDPGAGSIQLSQALKGTGIFSKKGAGPLQLTSTANFASTLDVRVDEGKLQTAVGSSTPVGGSNKLTISAGAAWDDSWGNGESIGSLNGAGTYIARAGSVGLNIGASGLDSTFSGKITAGTDGVIGATNSARSLSWFNKYGNGTLTLSGSQSDVQVRFHVQQGTVSINNLSDRGQPSALGVGVYGVNPDISIGLSTQAATLQYTGPSTLTNRRIDVQHATGSIIDVTQASSSLTVGIVGGANAAAGLTKNGAGQLVLAGNATYTGATRVNQGILQFDGMLTSSSIYAAGGTGVVLNNSNISRSIPITLEAGASLSAAAGANGGVYDGIGSTAAVGVGLLGSRVTILDGANSATSAAMVRMAWRARSPGESANGPAKLFSDVLDLTGITNTGAGTDVFVLSMSYDPAQLAGAEENSLALAWLDGGTWKNAVEGNVGGIRRFDTGAFADTGAPGLTDDLGRCGVDPSTDTVWAVLNHNSEFGVTVAVPEPTSIGILSLIAGALMRRRRAQARAIVE